MKSFILASVVFVAALSQATSQYFGPYLYKEIGNYTCNIKPYGVSVIVDGKRVSQKPLKLDPKKLQQLIEMAEHDKMRVSGLHMVKTNPAVVIGAGISPQVFSFTLYEDSSRVMKMSGQAATTLINLVNTHCD